MPKPDLKRIPLKGRAPRKPDPSEALLDVLIRIQAMFLRDGERAVANASKILAELDQTLQADLAKRFSQGMVPKTRRQLEQAIKSIQDAQSGALLNYGRTVRDNALDLTVEAQAEILRHAEVTPGFGLNRKLSRLQIREMAAQDIIGENAARAFFDAAALSNKRTQKILRVAYAEGASFETIFARMRNFSQIRNRQQETLARTVIQGTANNSAHRLYDQNKRLLEGKQWVATLDDATCPECGPLDGQVFWYDGRSPSVDEMPQAPLHPNCVVGETGVRVGSDILATSKRWYRGDILTIRVGRNGKFSCTPNHPVLTERGWVAAGELHEGSRVIRSILGDLASCRKPDYQDMPPTIEEVAGACGGPRGMAAHEVPVSPVDFHGDGRGSEVAIVRAHRLLWDGIDSPFVQHSGENFFLRRLVVSAKLSGLGRLYHGLPGLGHAARCVVGLADLVRSLLRVHSGPLEGFGLTSPPPLDASLQEKPLGQDPGNPEKLRASVLRLSGEVQADEVVRVNVRSFAGHVFNLQTGDGIYSANGIVTHNCRCFAAPVVKGFGAPKSPTWSDWIQRQDTASQNEILGPTRGRLMRAGLINPSDLQGRHGVTRPVADLVKIAERRKAA